MADTEDTAALKAQVALLKQFLTDHPEVAAELGVEAAADAGPPVPLTLAHIFHELIDTLPFTGADAERRQQYHDVADEHLAPADTEPAAGSTEVFTPPA